MEHTLVHLAATAAWFLVVVFIFAAIGVYATVRWIVGLFTRAERGVQAGVGEIGRRL